MPKIEIQMPTPICENKDFEQQKQVQPRPSGFDGLGSEDKLPTIMVQSATPVATPVLEHKVYSTIMVWKNHA